MSKIKDCKHRIVKDDGAICTSHERKKATGKENLPCPFDPEQDSTACFDFEPKKAGIICGGVVKQSEFFKNPMAYLICYVLPDKDYEKWEQAVKNRDWERARKIVKRKAWSPI